MKNGKRQKTSSRTMTTMTSDHCAEGRYQIKTRWKTGWFTKSDGTREWYDSSYEKTQMERYEQEGVLWTKRHRMRIPYVNKDGLQTYYVPDFLVTRNGVRSVEEVKGWMDESVKIKALYAIRYCGERGMNYRLLLGKELVVVPEFSAE